MKKKYDVIIFDLDGTITESDLGITNSIRYSLNYFGIKKERESLLNYSNNTSNKMYELPETLCMPKNR